MVLEKMVILGQKGQFWKFLAKMTKTVKIFKKALGTFFSHLKALTVMFQKKVMRSFREKALHTDGRADLTPKVSTTSWSRDQKFKIVDE